MVHKIERFFLVRFILVAVLLFCFISVNWAQAKGEKPQEKIAKLRERWQLVPQTAHSDCILSIAVSKTGSLVASGSADGTVRLWNYQTGELLRIFQLHGGKVYAVTFYGNRIVSADESGTIHLLGADFIYVLRTALSSVRSISLHNGIVFGGGGGFVRYFKGSFGNMDYRATFRAHKGGVRSVIFLRKLEQIVSGGDDGMIRIWDANINALRDIKYSVLRARGIVADYHLLSTIPVGGGAVLSLATSPENDFIASAHEDGIIRLWNTRTRKLIASLQGHDGAIYSIAVSPDGKYLVSGGQDGQILLWNVSSKKLERVIAQKGKAIKSVVFSHNGKYILAGGDDCAIRVWSAAFNDLVRSIGGCSGAIKSASVSIMRDGQINFHLIDDKNKEIILDVLDLNAYNYNKHLNNANKKYFSKIIRLLYGGSVLDVAFFDKEKNYGVVFFHVALLPKDEWVIWLPWGPYMASAGANKYLRIVKRKGFEAQPVTAAWREIFFRPDGFKPEDLVPPPGFYSK